MHITKSGLSSWPLRLLTPSWRLLGVGSLHPQRPLPVWPRRQLLEQVVSLRPSRPSQWFHQRIPQRKLQRHQWLTWIKEWSEESHQETQVKVGSQTLCSLCRLATACEATSWQEPSSTSTCKWGVRNWAAQEGRVELGLWNQYPLLGEVPVRHQHLFLVVRRVW